MRHILTQLAQIYTYFLSQIHTYCLSRVLVCYVGWGVLMYRFMFFAFTFVKLKHVFLHVAVKEMASLLKELHKRKERK